MHYWIVLVKGDHPDLPLGWWDVVETEGDGIEEAREAARRAMLDDGTLNPVNEIVAFSACLRPLKSLDVEELPIELWSDEEESRLAAAEDARAKEARRREYEKLRKEFG